MRGHDRTQLVKWSNKGGEGTLNIHGGFVFHTSESLTGLSNHDRLKEESISSSLLFLKQHFVESTKARLLISEKEMSWTASRYGRSARCSPVGLQEKGLWRRSALFWDFIQRIKFLTDVLGRTECLETSVRNSQSTLRKIPRELGSHIHRGGNLKYAKVYAVLFRREPMITLQTSRHGISQSAQNALTFQSLAVSIRTVPPGLTLKNTIWCSLCVECFVRISEETATFAVCVINGLLTYSMVHSPSWEANWFAAGQEIARIFTEPEGSLPHSQASTTCPCPGPAQSSPHTHIPPPGNPS